MNSRDATDKTSIDNFKKSGWVEGMTRRRSPRGSDDNATISPRGAHGVERMAERLLGERPPSRRRKADWGELVNLGIYGMLATVLNDGIPMPPKSQPIPRDLPGLLTHYIASQQMRWPVGLGQKLARIYRTWGWKSLQAALLLTPLPPASRPARAWRFAVLESLLFEKAHFHVLRCTHGLHFFVSDDPRRADCLEHRLVGRQTRLRANKRRRAVLQRLGRHGVKHEELRQQVRILEGGALRIMRRGTLDATLSELIKSGDARVRTDSEGQKWIYRSTPDGGERDGARGARTI
jgi:hypothetical protein